jgi:superfamily II DNA/RNA helicase
MGSLTTQVSSDICKMEQFQKDFALLTVNEFSEKRSPLAPQQIIQLLESSAVLSLSEEESHQKLAYKIAIYLLHRYSKKYDSIPFATQLILTRLGNLPAIDKMIKDKDGSDYFDFFSSEGEALNASLFFRFPEILEKKSFNRVQIANNRILTLTDFQIKILAYLRNRQDIAFSAPTSSGKSYVILNYLADKISSASHFAAIYIVPTKALVAEVQRDIIEILKTLNVPQNEFLIFTGSSILNEEEIRTIKKKVFVLTQERLQEILANERMNFEVDIVVLDEAQKIADENRGVVIEDAVQELIKKEPSIHRVFVSPYISNLEKFGNIFAMDPKRIQTLLTRKSPVAQNIFFVDFFKSMKKMGRRAVVSVLSQELSNGNVLNQIPLYEVNLERTPKESYEKKVWVAKNVINPILEVEPTLIYCNIPSHCRKVGELLSSELGKPSDDRMTPEIRQAISFLKQHVHPDYYLADFLRFGVGYHYGTMPQFVRFHVKELFDQKQIRFLACTSTLLEGVNLPAKNLILHNPKRGHLLPMDRLSVLNLIGRAGRLRKDYYGKIYCIDVKVDWETSEEVFKDKPESIESSSETTLSKYADDLINYLRDFSFKPSSGSVKSMATSLLMKQLLYPDTDFLSSFKARTKGVTEETLNKIRSLLAEKTKEISPLDKNVILKNRSFDPRFQFELYQVLKEETHHILPPYPQDSEFYKKLEGIFEKIAKYLLRRNDFWYKHYSYLSVKWIKQTPYKSILDSEIKHELERVRKLKKRDLDEKEKKQVTNDAIEDLDNAIEDEIKFNYSRGLKCYIDITERILSEENRQDVFCNNLSLLLESGASDRKILFLIGAGLSRNTAIEIFENFDDGRKLPQWDTIAATIQWLRQNNSTLQAYLHPIIYREIEKLLV